MYVTEVDVELVYTDDGWSPYLTVDDAKRLDEARDTLQRGDLNGGIPVRTSLYLDPSNFTNGRARPRYALNPFHVIQAILLFIGFLFPALCHFDRQGRNLFPFRKLFYSPENNFITCVLI